MPYHRPPDQRRPAERADNYLWFIRQQPCCICGDDVHVEAHHPRHGSAEDAGMAQKVDDRWALPLCGKHHRELHAFGNEREWWASYGVDPRQLALGFQVKVR
jgi:hypothetical protein